MSAILYGGHLLHYLITLNEKKIIVGFAVCKEKQIQHYLNVQVLLNFELPAARGSSRSVSSAKIFGRSS